MRGAGTPVADAPGRLVYPALCGVAYPTGRDTQIRQSHGDGPFYTYYQIGSADESDEAETEPQGDGELKNGFRPSHSPFGFIWQIADATGWSVDYILNKVNYQTLVMMLSDAPRYVSGARRPTYKPAEQTAPEAEAAEIANYFRSNLKL